jgi:hypothetical protein
MSNNVTLPRFGRASGVEAWNETDHFDVDLLAEFLLDDNNAFPNAVTFDFK